MLIFIDWTRSFGDDILPIIQFRICFLILFDTVSYLLSHTFWYGFVFAFSYCLIEWVLYLFSPILGILHDCAFKYSFVFVFVFAFFDTVSYLHSHTVWYGFVFVFSNCLGIFARLCIFWRWGEIKNTFLYLFSLIKCATTFHKFTFDRDYSTFCILE